MSMVCTLESNLKRYFRYGVQIAPAIQQFKALKLLAVIARQDASHKHSDQERNHNLGTGNQQNKVEDEIKQAINASQRARTCQHLNTKVDKAISS